MLRFGFEQENVHEKLLRCWIERSLKRSQSILKAPQSVVDQVKGYFAALGEKFLRSSRDLVAVNSIEIFLFPPTRPEKRLPSHLCGYQPEVMESIQMEQCVKAQYTALSFGSVTESSLQPNAGCTF